MGLWPKATHEKMHQVGEGRPHFAGTVDDLNPPMKAVKAVSRQNHEGK